MSELNSMPDQGVMTPAVALTDDVLWLFESFRLPTRVAAGDSTHTAVHVSVFLVRSAEGWIIIDSGSFHHRDRILARIGRTLGRDPIRALILSHSDYPHSANIGPLRRRWGDFEIVASCGSAEIQGLPYATRVPIGGSLSLANRTFRFLDPPLADRSHTSWIYDERDRILFVADGFGSYHSLEHVDRTSLDFSEGIARTAILDFHRDTLPWLRYADPKLMAQAFDSLFDQNPVEWVAPIHGHPIHHTSIGGYLGHLNDSIGQIVAEAR